MSKSKRSKRIFFTVLSIITAICLVFIVKSDNVYIYLKENMEMSATNNVNTGLFDMFLLYPQYLIFFIFYQCIDLLRDEPRILLFLSATISSEVILYGFLFVRNSLMYRQKKWNSDFDLAHKKVE